MMNRTATRMYTDGRDEMNLADFPISALQRTQLSDGDGGKLARLEFAATRYDAGAHKRVTQRVTLTSTASDGLPTPADEHVILALLYVTKHSDNFADATVFFAPGQLFEIMGWAPNGRSYDRLRNVLRRLKALNIRYENAWWDVAGRGYEEEVATGIISGYRIARQVSGPRTSSTALRSWVTWTQQFHESLKNGNIKRLNLDVFFKLSSPTAQRMYRFLDKRFYNNSEVSMDLIEFACGHIGLAENSNVAILKRRLAPAIAELEKIGFLAKADLEQRYQKVRAGSWRIVLKSAESVGPTEPDTVPPAQPDLLAMNSERLAREFYRLWESGSVLSPGPRDREQAEAVLKLHGVEVARALLPLLVQVTRKEWPECRSFSGAVQKYLPDALKLLQQNERRAAARLAADQQRDQEQQELAHRQQEERRCAERWNALAEEQRQAIRQQVTDRLGGSAAPESFIRRLCLEEVGRDV